MKKLIPVLIILLISVLISCNNGMGADITEDPDQTSGALVVTDPSKGVVFVDEAGDETVIKSVEGDEEIVCKSLIDYALFDETSESVSKSSVKRFGRRRAVILGYRSDGCPGLWIVYSGGIVKPVVNSEDVETSELLEMAESRQPLFKHFGWSYKALDMVVNDNEIIIAGYAENEEGISWLGIDPGTTIGLYWAVIEDDDGYYHISRARVVGYRDNEWWKRYRNELNKPGHRLRFRWLHSLRLFFFGWYDRYLVMTESVETGENPGEYLIKGTDDEGTASIAAVTVRKVLSIEEAPDDPDPDPDPEPTDPVDMVFSSDRDGDFEIYSFNPDTEEITKLTDNSSTDKHPALSSDGTKIAFVSDRSGTWELYAMNSDGSGISDPLAALSGAYDGHPSWNPDGTKIVYDNSGDLFIVNSDGSDNSNITNTASFPKEIEPSWSPDGTKILYSSNKDFDYDIYVMDVSGSSTAVNLSANSSQDQKPSWSPDGSKIAFSTNLDGNYEIYVMNSDGTSKVNLTGSSDNDRYPSWSSDGNNIAFERDGNIYSIHSDGASDAVLLVTDAGEPAW